MARGELDDDRARVGIDRDGAAQIRERIEWYVRDLIAEEQNDDIAVLVIRAR